MTMDDADINTPESKVDIICRLIKEVDKGFSCDVSAAEALEFRRDAYGLSVKDFCYILSISKSHYSEVINGKRQPPISLIRKAHSIGVPLQSLVYGVKNA